MICHSCHTPNSDGSRFCSDCGAELGAARSFGSTANSAAAAAAPAREVDDEATRVRPSVSAAQANTVISSEPGSGAQSKTAGTGATLIGRTIAEKYRIDGTLGAGGMGAVYRAHRLMIGDDVAIKVLHPQHVSEPEATERFRREAQAAARLKHQNAVSIYDFGVTSDGLVYLVMELVEGQSLRQIIKQQGPLTPSAAADVISQVCAALDEAHRHYIVHRDLKPDNIIVHASITGLRVKVLDFGIAKLRDLTAGNLTQTGSVMGTPHYMSPEQCLGEELDSRSDIYSLGVVLYEMLAGVVPFNSPMSTAVVVQHVNQAPTPPRSINLSISPAVEAVVLHALAKNRQERPQSAVMLAQELNAAVSGSGPGVSAYSQPATSFSLPTPSILGAQMGGQGMTPTVVLRTPTSGSSAAYPGQTSPVTPAYATQPHAARSAAKPIAIFAAIGGLAVMAVVLVLYFVFFSFSPKKAIMAEVKKGNVVKPQGSSAYDLFLKHKSSDLKKEDLDEIAKETVPQLEKRGDTILSNLKTEQIESEDEWVEATRVYSWLNELRPSSIFESKVYFSQASLAFAKKDYSGSLPNYQRAAKLQPNWSLVLNRLGRVYINLKDKSGAREYYRQATVAEPGWISPWINLGAICLDLNDPYSAESALRQAIGIDNQKASAHNLLGQALDRQSRYCEALQEYSTALELANTTPTSTVNVDAVRKRIAALNSMGLICGY